MSQLSACPSCQRHIRVSETACPFCDAALDEVFHAAPAARRPLARLSRAALFTFATGTAVAAGAGAIACSSQTAQAPLYGGPPVDENDSGQRAIYGGPPVDAGKDTGPTPTPAYGGPPVDVDAGDGG